MKMSIIEAVAIAAIFISLTQRALWPGNSATSWSLLVLGVGLVLIAFAVNPMRWQLAPAGLTLLFLLTQTIWAIRSGHVGGPSITYTVVGVALLGLSGALAWGFPTGRLPAPGGPYKVGVATAELTRPDPAPDRPLRHLTIKAWYPAASSSEPGRRQPLWSEVQDIKGMPAFVRALLAYMKRIKTHSIVDAPMANEAAPHPLLIYNHSLISFASENTLLMEWLASRGYIVLSIRHQEQVAEYTALQKGISKEEKARDRKLTSQLKKVSSREERARVSLALFDNSTGTSTLVRRRAEDSVFVLANLDQVLAAIPGVRSEDVALGGRFGALGLSLGGAVTTRLCIADERCLGAANLDGGLFGIDKTQALPGRYLMIYSEDNAGTNDAFADPAKDGYSETVLKDAKHLDLHDAAVVLPGLRWFGMLGAGSGSEKNRRMKETVTAFFDPIMKPSIGADREAEY
jgi:predicted dienelactone hydrolase